MNMQNLMAAVKETTAFLQEHGVGKCRAGIILGTGLNALINEIDIHKGFSYDDLPHFPTSTVEFHKGNLISGSINDCEVIAMQGRFHYYEGYNMQQITFPVRVMKELGIDYLLLSNAAGGMNPDFKKGDLIITEDHINLLPDNPLRGLGSEFGNRFVDMSEPYDKELQHMIEVEFDNRGIHVKKGTYVAVMGPNLETKAEYRWLRNMGADMVGMSTVPEVIVAGQLGVKCAAISVITDECDPENLLPVNISEIIEIAAKADKKLCAIFKNVIAKL
jgi:purine-nucleoside phosphorylase